MASHFKADRDAVVSDFCRTGSHYAAPAAAGSPGPGPDRPRSHSRRGFVVGAACLAALGAFAAIVPATATGLIDDIRAQAMQVADSLGQALDRMGGLDFAGARDLLAQACGEIGTFQQMVSGPIWDMAEALPFVGTDVKAARDIVAVLVDVVDEALLPFATTLSGYGFDSLVASDELGRTRVDLAGLSAVCMALGDALPALRRAADAVMGIEGLHMAELASAVGKAQEKIGPYVGVLDTLPGLLDALPDILGASGDRLYVVMAQNNVEIRSCGGFSGQCARIEVHDGAVSVGDVVSIYDYIKNNPQNCVPLTDEELALFGDTVGYMAGNTGAIPDFPRVCDIWRQLWYTCQGELPDGFIAVDPVFLQMLMGLTPGTEVYDGTRIDGTNTVRVLLHDTYWRFMDDPDAMDAFFSAAAGAALECIMSNVAQMGAADLVDVFARGFERGNLLLWMAEPREQQLMCDLGASGALSIDPQAPQLGIFLNNETWSKIEWWLDAHVELSEPRTDADGYAVYPCRLTLSNCATQAEIDQCNEYMLGGNERKLAPDDIFERVFVTAPASGSVRVVGVQGSGELVPSAYKGLEVLFGNVHNCIGEPFLVDLEVCVPPQARQPLALRVTPTVQDYR